MNAAENCDTANASRLLEKATFSLRADSPGQSVPAQEGNRASRRAQARTTRKADKVVRHAPAQARSRSSTTTPSTAPDTSATHESRSTANWACPPVENSAQWLKDMLGAFVPLEILQMHLVPRAALQQMASEAAEIIASHGDDLMFGGKHCAATYTALNNGLAAAALLAPAGIDFMGLHFCARPHPECPSASAIARPELGAEERPSCTASSDGDLG